MYFGNQYKFPFYRDLLTTTFGLDSNWIEPGIFKTIFQGYTILMPCPSIGSKRFWLVQFGVLNLSKIGIKTGPKHFGSVQNKLERPKSDLIHRFAYFSTSLVTFTDSTDLRQQEESLLVVHTVSLFCRINCCLIWGHISFENYCHFNLTLRRE